jgi:transcriptional regulator with XRE-family HTH domain
MEKERYGKQLRDARIHAGFTQKGVAVRINRPQQTIAAWEVGRSQPDLETLSELLRLYHISADEFLGCSEENNNPQLNMSEAEWVKRCRALDEHGKEIIKAVLAIEYERMEGKFSEFTLAAARGGGLSVLDVSAADASASEHIQVPGEFNL